MHHGGWLTCGLRKISLKESDIGAVWQRMDKEFVRLRKEYSHCRHSHPYFFAPSFIHSAISQIMLIYGPNQIQTFPTSPVFLENVSRAPVMRQALT